MLDVLSFLGGDDAASVFVGDVDPDVLGSGSFGQVLQVFQVVLGQTAV